MTDGEQIVDSIRKMRDFHESVALLLRTAEAQMEAGGWERKGRKAAIGEGSKSIDYPRHWTPAEAFVFMVFKSKPNILAFVSVVFDHIDKPKLVSEPLVSAGIIDYGESNKIDGWEYWYSHIHLWMPNRKDDGTILAAERIEAWPDWTEKFQSARTLAVPLTDVTSSELLHVKVTAPILAIIPEQAGRKKPQSE